MALTETQKAEIRLYLGYPDQWRYKHTRLESILDNNLSSEAEVQIAAVLVDLASIEARLLAAMSSAGVKKVDEIEFFPAMNGAGVIPQLRRHGRMLAGRLSIIVGVPIYSDVFGSQGYLGDSFFPGFGSSTGGGGLLPIG